jgi:hypothetical protein
MRKPRRGSPYITPVLTTAPAPLGAMTANLK